MKLLQEQKEVRDIRDFINLLKLCSLYEANTKIGKDKEYLLSILEKILDEWETMESALIHYTFASYGKQRIFRQIDGDFYDRDFDDSVCLNELISRVIEETRKEETHEN